MLRKCISSHDIEVIFNMIATIETNMHQYRAEMMQRRKMKTETVKSIDANFVL